MEEFPSDNIKLKIDVRLMLNRNQSKLCSYIGRKRKFLEFSPDIFSEGFCLLVAEVGLCLGKVITGAPAVI